MLNRNHWKFQTELIKAEVNIGTVLNISEKVVNYIELRVQQTYVNFEEVENLGAFF